MEKGWSLLGLWFRSATRSQQIFLDFYSATTRAGYKPGQLNHHPWYFFLIGVISCYPYRGWWRSLMAMSTRQYVSVFSFSSEPHVWLIVIPDTCSQKRHRKPSDLFPVSSLHSHRTVEIPPPHILRSCQCKRPPPPWRGWGAALNGNKGPPQVGRRNALCVWNLTPAWQKAFYFLPQRRKAEWSLTWAASGSCKILSRARLKSQTSYHKCAIKVSRLKVSIPHRWYWQLKWWQIRF